VEALSLSLYIAAGMLAVGIVGGYVAYSKGYDHGALVIEQRYHKAAQIAKGKMSNVPVPKSDAELIDDLRRFKF
jgi:uncharacterized protein (UPF0333 family)